MPPSLYMDASLQDTAIWLTFVCVEGVQNDFGYLSSFFCGI